ncbi:MAG: Zinc/iron permease [Candidatus Roizmanbacteria bacterium GW2011_GWA2_35_8]|uniref:Zinc/iron permease n=1 Tax=Candidatus Roizmanbacteria bacterium GW2011_GWA2_35_8 TaxID=1618479 RepID=A0A0G0CVP4_9BACT|nr:MAG: Zinc/iron permease [Candidatus Roizmanbacteria bacterium GW2011_GWA2_35_8]
MLYPIIIANIIISLISLIGGIAIIQKTFLSKKIIPYMVAFAAGVILTTVFLDLLPEALEKAKGTGVNIFTPIFIGILFSFFLERFVLWFHHHESTHGIRPSLFLVIIGDGIHNFIDGVVIASAFGISFPLGVVTSFAIAAHEIPQEIADLGILIHSGLSKRWALILNLLSALTAIAGGIIAFYFLSSLKNSLPILLSFSSGIFIYIAGSDLIPGLHKEYRKQKKWAQVIPFIAGILLMYFMTIFLNGKH